VTDQEQAVADRLIVMLDEVAAKEDWVPVGGILRAVAALELTPVECTTDVLRALWAVAGEFSTGASPNSWVVPVWRAVRMRKKAGDEA